ncbi:MULTISPECIES: hypothetical protein [Thermococcus]|uniref:Uncharacterized protein n=1 Tax=Thermococcus nautili TaxID=195522 RepID=W8P6B4_9EURY|nr:MULTISPECIES: hypothetical protein [Thermococcus]AHL23065.1 hypothetical protein BD01_1454 [Thermococcus nautili]NJE49440.1 hypothetical protein [Thermococcus sp. 9N3]CAI1492473.1 conserved protein of unknown function [Thermococcus nautili]
MKIIFTEGPLDVLLIRSILVKVFCLEDITRSDYASPIRRHFRNLLINFQVDGVIRIVRTPNDESIVIASVEGKDNFLKIASAIKPLRRVAEEIHETLNGVIFVGDRDAWSILNRLNNPKGEVPVSTLAYEGYMEDLLFKIFKNVEKELDSLELEVYKKVLGPVSKFKDIDGDTWKKRKLSLLHLVFGPRCFENLFENLCSKLTDKWRGVEEISHLADLLEVSKE